ncbi:MAG: radical SAM protein [Candidatus Omnitrophica bacterium]|nr:radical SAM protein [Candidatus Omnitrophota bacterium]
MRNSYKYIYGPVPSWRLGNSLGVDLISREDKVCTFDCVYCQIGPTRVANEEREVFVPTKLVLDEIKSLPDLKIDYITFSGRGEPTLARNLGETIREIKKIRQEKIAVITNSSLMGRKDVKEDLALADMVMAKLDACCEVPFLRINKAAEGITFDKTLKGIKEFKSGYKGRLALQIMFIEDNKKCAGEIARLAKEIDPEEVQINTPLRPCGAEALSVEDINKIKESFRDMNVISVYDAEKRKAKSINKEDTLRRRGSHD